MYITHITRIYDETRIFQTSSSSSSYMRLEFEIQERKKKKLVMAKKETFFSKPKCKCKILKIMETNMLRILNMQCTGFEKRIMNRNFQLCFFSLLNYIHFVFVNSKTKQNKKTFQRN